MNSHKRFGFMADPAPSLPQGNAGSYAFPQSKEEPDGFNSNSTERQRAVPIDR